MLKRFGLAVRKRREKLGMTQSRLAELAQIGQSHISKIELGKENVSLTRIERIAKALKCRLEDLLKEE